VSERDPAARQQLSVLEMSDTLGLPPKTIRRKLRWGRWLVMLSPGAGPRSEPAALADGQLLRELRDRIRALEQRLDAAELERRQLLETFEAERRRLLDVILEKENARWPGLWPWLKRFWLGDDAAGRHGGD